MDVERHPGNVLPNISSKMNNKTKLAIFGALVLIALAAFLLLRGGGTSTVEGKVTAVNLDNWKQEVDDVQGSTPVLIFYTKTGVAPSQEEVVRRFAKANGGTVRVVMLNCDESKVVVLALKYGVDKYPGFVVLYKDNATVGPVGAPASGTDLDALVKKARGS